jgi:hypothetical protein
LKRMSVIAAVSGLAALVVAVFMTMGSGNVSAQEGQPGGSDNPCDPSVEVTERPTQGTDGVIVQAQTNDPCIPLVQLCHRFTNGTWGLIWVQAPEVPKSLLSGDVYPTIDGCPKDPTPTATPNRTPTVTSTSTPAVTATPPAVTTTATATATGTVTATATKTATATATAVSTIVPLPPKTGNGGLVGNDGGSRNIVVAALAAAVALGAAGTFQLRKRRQS